MLQNIPKEKVLEIVAQGPTLPAKIAKQVGGDTMLIGAILSTIMTTGKIKVSSLKIGGSPLYYIPDHESKLEEYVDHLNEKDRRTFLMLKDKKVVSDEAADPLTRVSLKAIKDFAKPVFIDRPGGIKALYWRFYSVSEDDAMVSAQKIANAASIFATTVQQPQAAVQPQQPTAPAPEHSEPRIEPHIQSAHTTTHADVHIQSSHIEEQRPAHLAPLKDIQPINISTINKNAQNDSHTIPPENQEIPAGLKEDKHESHPKEHHARSHAHAAAHSAGHDSHAKKHASHAHVSHSDHPKAHKEKEDKHEEKEHKEDKESKETAKPKEENHAEDKRDFYEIILEFISKSGLDMISKEKIKKSEYNIILKNHNTNEYIYCKAKDKSTINEGDLAPALIFAQNKKMPCLFLSTGELAKKTSTMMNSEFSALAFRRIGVSEQKPLAANLAASAEAGN